MSLKFQFPYQSCNHDIVFKEPIYILKIDTDKDAIAEMQKEKSDTWDAAEKIRTNIDVEKHLWEPVQTNPFHFWNT